MKFQQTHRCDVLVVGAGIAGVMAAIEAAQAGKTVCLCAAAQVFSGSSFYPGTWGLGLIAPENDADEDDLARTILSVGCGMADEQMVHTLVSGIRPAVEQVQQMGVRMKEAHARQQRDFIPCFDHKHRAWHGLLFDSVREVFSARLEALGIRQLPYCELLDLLMADGRVSGGVFRQAHQAGGDTLLAVYSGAVVLATGGFGGLFERRLTTDDVSGVGQVLALRAGCRLVNLEFMQMMPGYVSPCYATIFNEKTFRYVTLTKDGRDILSGSGDEKALLALRSTHGPFTCRLPSCAVDFAVAEAAGEQGVEARYAEAMQQDMPEFIRTYFDWLRENKQLTPRDPVFLAMFAHAANGGIQIAPDASTPVAGLFACGEVTGGMHGADRLGGLSTANGLVFGGKAGRSAARFCELLGPPPQPPSAWEPQGLDGGDMVWQRALLRRTMTTCGMVVRDEKRLCEGLSVMEALREAGRRPVPPNDLQALAAARRLWAQRQLATAVLQAQRQRRESRGAHYRADYPAESRAFDRPLILSAQADDGTVCFEAAQGGTP